MSNIYTPVPAKGYPVPAPEEAGLMTWAWRQEMRWMPISGNRPASEAPVPPDVPV